MEEYSKKERLLQDIVELQKEMEEGVEKRKLPQKGREQSAVIRQTILYVINRYTTNMKYINQASEHSKQRERLYHV